MAPHQKLSSAVLLFLIVTQGGAVPVSDTGSNKNVISPQDISKPSAKQGILEIPKNVASLIRNTIDYGLQTYLNFTTPPPDPYRPSSLGDSIIGHYLLGNVYPAPNRIPAAPAYQPNKPIPTLGSTFFHTEAPTLPPPRPPTPAPKTPETNPQPETPTKASPAKSPTKVHTLDTDSSISGIFNSNGLFLNTVDEEDVYYVGPTKGSIVFPIVTSTTPAAITAPATEATEAAPTSTSEGTGGDEDEDVEEGFEESELKELKKSV
ncbi:hypothetical protein Ocin01_03712 [Orchesella cincta]|uniref:Uncharacterized protein n=1 Tax=Orchesella cincta TaxID=48709 RepID=A0A1D2NCZ9_ORCCI|nr:hypothetical protein Ocin01_03712 [Orchesella cincta]